MREEKRSEILQDALQYLDEDMIENVEQLRGGVVKEGIEHSSSNQTVISKSEKDASRTVKNPVKRYWHRGIAIAASIAVFLMGGWVWNNVIAPSQDKVGMENIEESDMQESHSKLEKEQESVEDLSNKEDDTDGIGAKPESETLIEGIEIPVMKVNLKKYAENMEVDMIGFFIYQGRSYVQSCEYYQEDIGFLGQKLGTATGLIDEWTQEDGYVELAGSACGDFYEIEGVDSEFMLAFEYAGDDNRTIDLYVNNNGITLNKGADIMVDRLHLKDNYKEVSFLTHADLEAAWAVGASVDMETRPLSNEYKELIERFVDSYCEGQFVKSEFNGVDGRSYDHIYHLYFTLNSGVRMHFTLLGDGYVRFQGLDQVCVQIDEAVYDEVIQLLKDAS